MGAQRDAAASSFEPQNPATQPSVEIGADDAKIIVGVMLQINYLRTVGAVSPRPRSARVSKNERRRTFAEQAAAGQTELALGDVS